MSPLRLHDRLDELEREIDRLRLEVVAREREAGELLDGEDASERADRLVAAAHLLLKAKLDLHYDESKAARARSCPVHGDALIVFCADCSKAWSFQSARVI